MTLTFTYGTQSGGVTTDYQIGVTQIASSLGRTMSFTSGVPGEASFTATTNGITAGQQPAAPNSIADAAS